MSEDDIDKKALEDSIRNYYQKKGVNYEDVKNKEPIYNSPKAPEGVVSANDVAPKQSNFQSPENFQSRIENETDPDLMVTYEEIMLPSKGYFYENGMDKVNMEYLTTQDEDILTTPSLIENGTVLDVILKKKIKTPNVNIDNLLTGDKNALLLFLRASSYGQDYDVTVTDPRNGMPFKDTIDLTKLGFKELKELPDKNGLFHLELPMRKKTVSFKLLTSGEENRLFKQAENMKEAYNQEYSQFNTMKLKAHIVNIDGNSDRSYISRFVDAMPLKDSFTLKRKILDVSPDINTEYTFKAKDGYTFKANISIGIDFFFPNL